MKLNDHKIIKKKLIYFVYILGIIFISVIGSFFIYQYIQKEQTLPLYLQETKNKQSSSFTVYDLNHKLISLDSLKNKVVIINFWATWCAPCIEELPSLNALAKHFSKHIIILAVSNESRDDIYNFLMAFPEFNSNFIPSNVSLSKMKHFFNVQSFPETYILNKQKKIVYKIIGSKKWDSVEWKNKIKKLINTPQKK